MEPRKHSRVWLWVGGILAALTIAGLVIVGLVAAGVIAAVRDVGEVLSSETEATIRPRTVDGRVEFEMTYGKDVVRLAAFIVRDADGTELWRVDSVGGDSKPARVVYGALPDDPAGEWRQEFPADGKPPADIRGRLVQVEASCGYRGLMGGGHQSSRAEFDIPR
jgi:hypothetical protein